MSPVIRTYAAHLLPVVLGLGLVACKADDASKPTVPTAAASAAASAAPEARSAHALTVKKLDGSEVNRLGTK